MADCRTGLSHLKNGRNSPAFSSVDLGSGGSEGPATEHINQQVTRGATAGETRGNSGKPDGVVAPFRTHILPTEAKATHVYVIVRADGLCKVGISRNAKRRLRGMRAAHPDKLTLHHSERPTEASAREIERCAHLLLARWRVSGEWFRCEPGLAILAIKAARTGELRLVEAIERAWLAPRTMGERFAQALAESRSKRSVGRRR